MISKVSRNIGLGHSITVLLLGALVCFAPPGPQVQGHELHAHHAKEAQGGYVRTVHAYAIPDIMLVDMHGNDVSLVSELNSDTPLMLNFIFTTCTTICPVMSVTFSQAQMALATKGAQPRMVSISIDPEHDTPPRLRAYAQKFRATPGWQFMTGDPAAIIALQRAFDAYRGANKMNHPLLTLLRGSANGPWVRLEGAASAADLVREYHELIRNGS